MGVEVLNEGSGSIEGGLRHLATSSIINGRRCPCRRMPPAVDDAVDGRPRQSILPSLLSKNYLCIAYS